MITGDSVCVYVFVCLCVCAYGVQQWRGCKPPSLIVPPLVAASLSLSPLPPQLTVGTWFKLYSLALSLRLAMLLAMFIPWDVLVLEQVGG